jgi:hypothetical protein
MSEVKEWHRKAAGSILHHWPVAGELGPNTIADIIESFDPGETYPDVRDAWHQEIATRYAWERRAKTADAALAEAVALLWEGSDKGWSTDWNNRVQSFLTEQEAKHGK